MCCNVSLAVLSACRQIGSAVHPKAVVHKPLFSGSFSSPNGQKQLYRPALSRMKDLPIKSVLAERVGLSETKDFFGGVYDDYSERVAN